MRGYKISDIAAALSATFEGDGDRIVLRSSEPADAGASDLAVAMSPKFADELTAGQASAAILWAGADWRALGLKAAILVDRPRLAMAALTQHFKPEHSAPTGIHPTALVDPTAQIGTRASIGAYTVIGAETKIGADARIGDHVSVGAHSSLGDGCDLQPGTRIGTGVLIGDRFIAHAGVAIGGDGFSFVTASVSRVENVRKNMDAPAAPESANGDQEWVKIQSLGGVKIGDDVEIGSNSSVDAGTIRPTIIGEGTKLDALVQVGHNVVVGRNCLLCAHVAVGGSARLGDGVVLGGQAGVADNINIGDGVIAGGASKILSNVPAGRAILGYPAIKMATQVETYKILRRLPRIIENLRAGQKTVSKDQTKD